VPEHDDGFVSRRPPLSRNTVERSSRGCKVLHLRAKILSSGRISAGRRILLHQARQKSRDALITFEVDTLAANSIRARRHFCANSIRSSAVRKPLH
jgi:hypothetical protein